MRTAAIVNFGLNPFLRHGSFIATTPNPRIFLSPGEASGDAYGAQLLSALRSRIPDATFTANGQKVAKIAQAQSVAHLFGSNVPNTGLVSNAISLSGANGITIQSGDTVYLWQYTANENGIAGGIWLGFSDGNYSTSGRCGTLLDQDGQQANLDGITGSWHQRRIDISACAGETISNFVLLDERNGAVNRFDFYFADVVLRRADGTLYPLWTGGQASSLTASTAGPGSATGVGVDGGLPAGVDSSAPSTHFYVDDHLGSMQMELASGGWPLWQGQFTPFGEEIVNHQATNAWLGPQNADGTTMHYKFTGKERDAESGLDYFGARYYASMTGRFMSPDWSAKAEPVPYSSLDNPQTLNLYAYVGNNPLSRTDPNGHCMFGSGGAVCDPHCICLAPVNLMPHVNVTNTFTNESRHLSSKGRQALESYERPPAKSWHNGKSYPYPDNLKIPTEGFGHAIKPGEDFSSGLDSTQMDALFATDIGKFENATKTWNPFKLPQAQFDALVMLHFNVGGAELDPERQGPYSQWDDPSLWVQYDQGKVNGAKQPIAGLANRRIHEYLMGLPSYVDQLIQDAR